MTGEPKRLTDPGSKSSASLRKLLEAGRSEQPGRTRMVNVGARLGFGPGAAGGALKVASTAFTVGAGKLGVAALLVAGVTAGAVAMQAHESGLTNVPTRTAPARPQSQESLLAEPTSRASGVVPVPVPLATVGEGEPTARVGVSSASPRPSIVAPVVSPVDERGVVGAGVAPGVALAASAVGPSGAPQVSNGVGVVPAEPSDLAAETEVELLEQARQALRSDPAQALSFVERDARRFPGGGLAQEREVIAIEALVRLGRREEASARAASFEQTYPGSAHGPRVEALVHGGADGGRHNP